MAQAKGMENKEILREVKKTIPAAAAIRVLYSGDIDVTMPDKASKDRAQGIPPTEALKIYRKDYLIEVLEVLLSLQVAGEKNVNNTTLAAAICKAS
jgi:UDP-N-acetylmuramyl pentapeptide synthase